MYFEWCAIRLEPQLIFHAVILLLWLCALVQFECSAGSFKQLWCAFRLHSTVFVYAVSLKQLNCTCNYCESTGTFNIHCFTYKYKVALLICFYISRQQQLYVILFIVGLRIRFFLVPSIVQFKCASFTLFYPNIKYMLVYFLMIIDIIINSYFLSCTHISCVSMNQLV